MRGRLIVRVFLEISAGTRLILQPSLAADPSPPADSKSIVSIDCSFLNVPPARHTQYISLITSPFLYMRNNCDVCDAIMALSPTNEREKAPKQMCFVQLAPDSFTQAIHFITL